MALLLFSLLSLFLIPLAIAHGIAGIIASNDDLSTLHSIITEYPELVEALSTANGTFFAPNNDALENFISSLEDPATFTPDVVNDLFAYHLLPLVHAASELSVTGGQIVSTSLLDEAYANLEGASNVLFTSAYGSTGQESALGALKVYSGVGGEATVTRPDLEYDGGLVHVIDRVLNFPQPCTKTAEAASLTTLFDAIQKTNLTEVVDTTAKFTCFAPTNEAFQAAGIDLNALSNQQIVDALKYHSIVGDVGYSTAFEDGQEYQTLLGVPVTVHKRDGQLFINDVAVQQGNVIMSNGVAHVLSGVLTPPPASDGTVTTVSGDISAAASATSAGSAADTVATAGALPLRASGLVWSDFVAILISLCFIFA
ncbi:hypothetical protein NMY22_g5846 [Coprinellus aureogranulatus]|nr:hypothetical protein NMY22_g5846 [Coprinellus aureogranulatus]